MLPEGFEPPITVPKTVVISISPQEHLFVNKKIRNEYTLYCKKKLYTVYYATYAGMV